MSEATKTPPATVTTSALPCSPGCGLDLTIEKAKIATIAAPIGATRRRRAAILLARACLSAASVGTADSAPGSPVMLAMLRTRAPDSIGRWLEMRAVAPPPVGGDAPTRGAVAAARELQSVRRRGGAARPRSL